MGCARDTDLEDRFHTLTLVSGALRAVGAAKVSVALYCLVVACSFRGSRKCPTKHDAPGSRGLTKIITIGVLDQGLGRSVV